MNNTLVSVPTDNLLTQQPALKRLLWVLQHNNEFGLYFARCNVPNYREQLVAALRAHHPNIIEISINQLDAKAIELDIALAEYLQDKPPNAAIFLYDLETRLPTKDTKQQHRTLQQINWRRSAYARLQRCLVIWLPDYALRICARGAPDFFDWYSGIYEFEVPETQRNDFIAQSLSLFDENKQIHAADHLSVAEKHRWIKTLLSLKDEIQSDTPSGRQSLADLLDDLGRLHKSLGEYEQALDYYQSARKYYLDIENKKGEGTTLNNISRVYHARGDYDTALDYLLKSLSIVREIGDKQGEGRNLNNISLVYQARGDYDTALDYLLKSLSIVREIGDKQGEGRNLNNISRVYQARGDYDTALDYLLKSLEILREIGDVAGMCPTLFNIGHIYWTKKDKQQAIAHWVNAYEIAKQIGYAQALSALENMAKHLGGEGLEYWENIKSEKKN